MGPGLRRDDGLRVTKRNALVMLSGNPSPRLSPLKQTPVNAARVRLVKYRWTGTRRPATDRETINDQETDAGSCNAGRDDELRVCPG
ncbi:hypothetical protein GCM10027318_39660 [Massilia agilis]